MALFRVLWKPTDPLRPPWAEAGVIRTLTTTSDASRSVPRCYRLPRLANASQKHANDPFQEPEDEDDQEVGPEEAFEDATQEQVDLDDIAQNEGGDGPALPVSCTRCLRCMAGDPIKYCLHRCAFSARSAANRCSWCIKNNKTCTPVSRFALLSLSPLTSPGDFCGSRADSVSSRHERPCAFLAAWRERGVRSVP